MSWNAQTGGFITGLWKETRDGVERRNCRMAGKKGAGLTLSACRQLNFYESFRSFVGKYPIFIFTSNEDLMTTATRPSR